MSNVRFGLFGGVLPTNQGSRTLLDRMASCQ
jgi:hypothetical protein